MKKILIIDDKDYRRDALKSVLSGKPYRIFEAESGSQGVTLSRREKPDLVLLDALQTSCPNGFEVCRQLKAAPETRHASVIMLVEPDQDPDSGQKHVASADGYLARPLHLQTLLGLVEQMLNGENDE